MPQPEGAKKPDCSFVDVLIIDKENTVYICVQVPWLNHAFRSNHKSRQKRHQQRIQILVLQFFSQLRIDYLVEQILSTQQLVFTLGQVPPLSSGKIFLAL